MRVSETSSTHSLDDDSYSESIRTQHSTRMYFQRNFSRLIVVFKNFQLPNLEKNDGGAILGQL